MIKGAERNRPIGVFDSGLGGLTVVKELMRALPGEDIVYYGDTARVPYGTKSKDSIIRFSRENTQILLDHNVKMVVVACNSSSSHALEILREEFAVPIIGVIHAGAKKAVQVSKNRKIGVVATTATVKSGQYQRSIKRFGRRLRVIPMACPMFVPLVEEGWLKKPVTLSVAKEYLAPLKKAGIDTLILGCTHYPLLKPVLRKVMGKRVVLVDSAKEVAREVNMILTKAAAKSSLRRKARCQYLISDRPQEFQKIARRFMGKEIKVECRGGF